MKRECKDCLHYGMSDDGDWYCRKHREHVQFINGCDDFWAAVHRWEREQTKLNERMDAIIREHAGEMEKPN